MIRGYVRLTTGQHGILRGSGYNPVECTQKGLQECYSQWKGTCNKGCHS